MYPTREIMPGNPYLKVVVAGEGGLDANPRGGLRQKGVGHELEEGQAGGRVADLHRPLGHQPVRPHVRHEVEGEGRARSGGDDLRACRPATAASVP